MTDTISSAASGSVPTKGCPSIVTASLPPLPGPSGLGTSAARITHEPDDESAYVEREWGDGTAPPLHCPVVDRVDPALAEAVDDRLVDWAGDCGFTDEQRDMMRAAGFGRLVMLTHSDAVDPDRLLVAAQLNAAWWAADDLYADDTEMGASATALPPRLALVMAAMDPVAPAGVFTAELDEALRGDPVLVALNSGVAHLSRHAAPAQVQRACYATFSMFVSWNAYAAWRHTGTYPPAWKYLATRQHDSFYTSMTLIDPVGGYEVDANLFYEPKVREAVTQAGTAAVLVNDLVSVAKDAADENPVCNMVLQIAADRDCSVEEATVVTVELHNQIVRDFEANRRELRAVPSPQLHRYLRGVRSWMGGGAEWHITNPRYRSA